MAKLRLIEENQTPEIQTPRNRIAEVVNEIVETGTVNKATARSLFNKYGLSLNLVAENMKNLLSVGEESTRLKVLQDLLKIHGALEEQVESKSVSINFNFANSEGKLEKFQVLIPR